MSTKQEKIYKFSKAFQKKRFSKGFKRDFIEKLKESQKEQDWQRREEKHVEGS